MVTSREITLAARPDGMPRESDFALVERDIPQPGPGEVLVRNIFMSVDPYMRGLMTGGTSYANAFPIGATLNGRAVGRVVASGAGEVPVGTYVFHMLGWREYALLDAAEVSPVDADAAPLEAYLGVLGFPGLTAYAGLIRIGAVKDGETVFVSAAAGAVGSVVCQLAKARGCRVIGSAGSDEKCRWLTETAGIDAAINYRTCGSLSEALGVVAPGGIDVYFDNVGGDHLEAAIDHMNLFGRIVLCGMIGQYNDSGARPGPANIIQAISRNLRLEGFVVRNHADLMPAFRAEASRLIAEGRLAWQETIENGIANAPKAFLKLFSGENSGKMLVRIGPDAPDAA